METQRKDVKKPALQQKTILMMNAWQLSSSYCPVSQTFPVRYSLAACLNVITSFLQCFCQITMLNRRAKYTVFYDAFICHAVCK